jgi:hypothetical protein
MSKDVNSNEMKNEDVLVGDYIRSTNELIGSIKKYNKELFHKVKESYENLYNPTLKSSDEKNKGWKRYKLDVHLDESTINKIVKIVKNDTIMKFYDQLPGSWGTLSVLTTMEQSDLMEIIESGRITPTSTKKEVLEIRQQYKGKQSNSGDTSNDKESLEVNHLWIDLDVLEVSDEERVLIEKLFNELEGYGFTILNDKESQSDDS